MIGSDGFEVGVETDFCVEALSIVEERDGRDGCDDMGRDSCVWNKEVTEVVLDEGGFAVETLRVFCERDWRVEEIELTGNANFDVLVELTDSDFDNEDFEAVKK